MPWFVQTSWLQARQKHRQSEGQSLHILGLLHMPKGWKHLQDAHDACLDSVCIGLFLFGYESIGYMYIYIYTVYTVSSSKLTWHRAPKSNRKIAIFPTLLRSAMFVVFRKGTVFRFRRWTFAGKSISSKLVFHTQFIQMTWISQISFNFHTEPAIDWPTHWVQLAIQERRCQLQRAPQRSRHSRLVARKMGFWFAQDARKQNSNKQKESIRYTIETVSHPGIQVVTMGRKKDHLKPWRPFPLSQVILKWRKEREKETFSWPCILQNVLGKHHLERARWGRGFLTI